MHEFSFDFLRCVRCRKKLTLEVLIKNKEIEEGFLFCDNCNITFPIINKIPILWDGFVNYLSNRPSLGGKLILESKNPKLKSFVKKSLSKITKKPEDRGKIEQRWTRIYQSSKQTKFYLLIKKHIQNIDSKISLEHGCSIGTITKFLAAKSEFAFGIDRSFSAIAVAKKTNLPNLDYFVADSLYHPFGNQKFCLVLALNLLEIIEPAEFIKIISKQISNGSVILSDPYDYERGQYSINKQLDANALRKTLQSYGFKISKNTLKENYIPWNLRLSPRAELRYKVDLILASKFNTKKGKIR